MLLGYASGDPGNQSRIGVSNPFNAFVHYFGGYVQDDWRLNPKTTVNLGVRLEHETGLMEENDSFTVAFDRNLNPGGAIRQRHQSRRRERRFAAVWSTPGSTAPTRIRETLRRSSFHRASGLSIRSIPKR